jgi:hypothetical protein
MTFGVPSWYTNCDMLRAKRVMSLYRDIRIRIFIRSGALIADGNGDRVRVSAVLHLLASWDQTKH